MTNVQMTSIACGIIDGYHMHQFISLNAFTSFRMLLSQNLNTLPFFFQIISDVRAFWLSTHFCLDFICMKGYFWINVDVLRKKFLILRVSGQNINGKYYSNACIVSLFSFWLIWLGGNVVFIHIICALHTFLSAFSYIMFIIFLCITFYQCLSRIMFGYCSKLSTI